MSVVTTIYAQAVGGVFGGTVNLLGDNIYIALLDSSYTADFDTDQFWSDVSSNEITGTGYTAGGYELVNKTFTYDAGTGLWTFTNTVDPSWSTATFTCRNAVMYDNSGTPSTSPLLTCAAFSADQTCTAETFTLHVASTGLLQTSQATG